MTGILAYQWGISGRTMQEILDNSEHFIYAQSYGKRRRTFRRRGGKRVYMYKAPIFNTPLVIRYGYRGELPKRVKTIQTVKGMTITANKLQFRQWAMENNISVPTAWVKGEEPNFNYPILGRPLKHSKGKNYHIIQDKDEYEKSKDGYYSVLIPKKREYRVFIFGGYVWSMCRKYPLGVGPLDPWNFSGGRATFKILHNTDWNKELCLLALKAAYKLDLLHCGADIIRDEDDNFWIVELNNAPAILGGLKPVNFSKVLDWTYERWKEGNLEIPNPKDLDVVRHPVLREG